MTTSPTAQMMTSGFTNVRCPGTNELMPNLVRNFDGFHISYARHIREYGEPTTALVLGGRVFLVLSGNHAIDMIEAAQRDGVQGCIDLFIARIGQANRLSEHRAAVGIDEDPFGLYPTTLQMIGQHSIERISAALRSPTSTTNAT